MILSRIVFIFAFVFLIFSVVAYPHSAHAAPLAPSVVTGLSVATTTTSEQEALSWNAPSDGGTAITDYTIEYRVRGDADWTVIDHVTGPATTVLLSDLSTDTIYEFHVAAINARGSGPFSDPFDFANNLLHTYVDASFRAGDDTNSRVLGINEFNTIQAAIHAVAFSGGVQVAPGTYSEDIDLNNKVELLGGTFGVGAPAGAPVLLAPDCNTMLDVGSESVVEGFVVDGNDPSHLCTHPLVFFDQDNVGGFEASTIQNAAIAIEAATSVGELGILSNIFQNDAVGIEADGTQNDLVAAYNYWGDPSGPLEARNNPGGLGASIVGAAADQVNFRAYLVSTDASVPVNSTSIDGAHVQDLFSNGGSFAYDILNNSDLFTALGQTLVTIPAAGGQSSVRIGTTAADDPMTVFVDSGDTFDPGQFSAVSIPASNVSGTSDSVIGDALQWGIPGEQLDYGDDNPIAVKLFVGDQYDGLTAPVYRSESLGGGWTQDGIVSPASCVVSGGLCAFTATSSSYYIATGTVIPPAAQTPAPRAASGGGSIVGLVGTTQPFEGIGSGYTAPRAQIVYPDGRVVYLDQSNLAPRADMRATTTQAYAFTKDLSFGMHDAAVQKLQQFLNAHGDIVSKSGAGSAGQETTYFGPATRAALALFQKENAIAPAAGYFGPVTRGEINATEAIQSPGVL